MPKSQKLDLNEIKHINFKKIYFDNDFSELAQVLNNLIVCNFQDEELSYDESFNRNYNKILDVFQLSIRHLHKLQNTNNEEVLDLFKKLTMKREKLKKFKIQEKDFSKKMSDLHEKMDKMEEETHKLEEQLQEMDFKYMCSDCLKVCDSKRDLFIHIKGTHNAKYNPEPYEKENYEFEEKEVQTKTYEENENNAHIVESYRMIEQNIDIKLSENITKIRDDLEKQFIVTDRKNEDLRSTIKELEINQIEMTKRKEEEQMRKLADNEATLKKLEEQLIYNSEIFNEFQKLILGFHQNEAKKLEDISKTVANLNVKTPEESESITDNLLDAEFQSKMRGHLELLERKLKDSPRKKRKGQQSPLKNNVFGKEWLVGDLESDQDSEENIIYLADLYSHFLKSQNPNDVIRRAEKEFKDLRDSKYKRRLDENEKHKNDKLLQKIDKKIEKSFKKKTQESLEESNRKEKDELEKILEEFQNSNNESFTKNDKSYNKAKSLIKPMNLI